MMHLQGSACVAAVLPVEKLVSLFNLAIDEHGAPKILGTSDYWLEGYQYHKPKHRLFNPRYAKQQRDPMLHDVFMRPLAVIQKLQLQPVIEIVGATSLDSDMAWVISRVFGSSQVGNQDAVIIPEYGLLLVMLGEVTGLQGLAVIDQLLPSFQAHDTRFICDDICVETITDYCCLLQRLLDPD
jgi:hypothetical protein